MKVHAILIVLCMFTLVMAAEGASAITGTIVSINPAGQQLTLLQDGNMTPVTVRLTGGRWPSFVKVGVRATAVGGYASGSGTEFNAVSIAPAPSKKRQNEDPTGVRSRLFKQFR